MQSVGDPITVPAGTFDVLNYKGVLTMSEDTPGMENPRYLNNYYADGIGKIVTTNSYVHAQRFIEKRLIRYHIEEQE